MRLQIVSDLHLEWQNDDGVRLLTRVQNADADALVLAGDVISLVEEVEAVSERQLRILCERFPRVYYVPGNHDFYGTAPAEALDRLAAIASRIDNLVVLESGRIDTFQGYRVLGATMWFPYDPGNSRYDGRDPRAHLADFLLIRGFVPWVYQRHADFAVFLEDHLCEEDIVVTHHLPSCKSVHPEFARSDLNRFFLSDQEALIRDRQPALWVHGHTHRSFDYPIGKTRVVCNPFGYPDERNSEFDPGQMVTLPDRL